MKINRTGSTLTFEIKAKPGGGYLAHCLDPAMTIEAETREALDAKLRDITEVMTGFELMKLAPRDGLVRDENGTFSININLWSSDDTPDPKKVEPRRRAFLWGVEFFKRFDYAFDTMAKIVLIALVVPVLIWLIFWRS